VSCAPSSEKEVAQDELKIAYGKHRDGPSNDLRATGRQRNVAIQVGLTVVVVIAAAALVLYIAMSDDQKPTGSAAKSIRVASSNLISPRWWRGYVGDATLDAAAQARTAGAQLRMKGQIRCRLTVFDILRRL
jgi:hypothetical protein